MGTVPNAVFERVMQAVDANRSAEVMTIANELLNAGNSPAQLARQAVRYLRSCVIAKIAGMTPDADGGVGGELLQISPEEQRRAARTAELFTEEELTRFLQVMLRTFDELCYRQEQRFHFELGLLKLVHLRRLLPVEQVLSSMGASAASPKANAGPVAVPKAPSVAAPAIAAKPAFSPFEQDKNRRRYDGVQGGANALAIAPEVKPIEPAPAPMLIARGEPKPIAATSLDADGLQAAVMDALRNARQGEAAEAMEISTWTIGEDEVRVQTELSATMLPMVINAEAEKIARGVVRASGWAKLTLIAAAVTQAAPAAKPRPVRTGSAQAKAMEHPMVQQAQKLFDAEIQTVIDLSGKD